MLRMTRFLTGAAALAASLLVSGCMASMPPVGEPRGVTPSANGSAVPLALQPVRWPVRTQEHLDLWLHGFALLHEEPAPAVTGAASPPSTPAIVPPVVPLFRPGYRDSLTVVKNRRGILTALDTNRAALVRGLQQSGGYLDAQFLPLAFGNWDAMRSAAERFLAANGGRAADRDEAAVFAQFAAVFPTAADRTWLRLFLTSLHDEWGKFFHQEYANVLRERAATITAIDSLWQQRFRGVFERYLANTAQRQGDFVLSLPIGGEGRTGISRAQRPLVAVPFPGQPADAVESLFGFVHEITGTLVGPVVTDNTTPAEQREGRAARLVAVAQVVAGAMVLQALAPELVDGYQRYYLRQTGTRVTANRVTANRVAANRPVSEAFDATFALPAVMRTALQRQIDLVLSGI
jgi:hypothetical protein